MRNQVRAGRCFGGPGEGFCCGGEEEKSPGGEMKGLGGRLEDLGVMEKVGCSEEGFGGKRGLGWFGGGFGVMEDSGGRFGESGVTKGMKVPPPFLSV